MSVINLLGADVLWHDDGSVDVCGTDADFLTRSLVHGKGVDNDWLKRAF